VTDGYSPSNNDDNTWMERECIPPSCYLDIFLVMVAFFTCQKALVRAIWSKPESIFFNASRGQFILVILLHNCLLGLDDAIIAGIVCSTIESSQVEFWFFMFP
jgi:hypothetical protein